MRRREFIVLLGAATVSWPPSALAQQVGKLPSIGFLGASAASTQAQWTAAFVQRLRELGWIEERTACDRVSFRGRTQRPLCRTGRRARAAQGRRHSHRRRRDAGRQECHIHHSHRLCSGCRPAGRRLCLELVASRRQRHRILGAGVRHGYQAAWPVARRSRGCGASRSWSIRTIPPRTRRPAKWKAPRATSRSKPFAAISTASRTLRRR